MQFWAPREQKRHRQERKALLNEKEQRVADARAQIREQARPDWQALFAQQVVGYEFRHVSRHLAPGGGSVGGGRGGVEGNIATKSPRATAICRGRPPLCGHRIGLGIRGDLAYFGSP